MNKQLSDEGVEYAASVVTQRVIRGDMEADYVRYFVSKSGCSNLKEMVAQDSFLVNLELDEGKTVAYAPFLLCEIPDNMMTQYTEPKEGHEIERL